jgi:alanine-glyoxylate transaminase/serine-glyoxylate transaminase/serine-pyruvate transaminase
MPGRKIRKSKLPSPNIWPYVPNPSILTSAGPTETAVVMPPGMDSDALIQHANRRLDMSLGIGLGTVKGKVFRIGHLGSLNELELLGGLAGLEMMLKEFGVPVRLGAGIAAAEASLLG